MITVLVCDDHPVVRAGITALLEQEADITVAVSAASGEEALELLAEHRVDVALMDLRMPGAGGVQTITKLSEAHPEIKVLVLTTYDSDAEIIAAVSAGAMGYLLKAAPAEDVVAAVRAVANGESVLSPKIASSLVSVIHDKTATLSSREIMVLQELKLGLSNSEIAAKLFISTSTVKTHLVKIFEKLEVTTRTRAVTRAQELGLL